MFRRLTLFLSVFVILLLPPFGMQWAAADYGIGAKQPPGDPQQAKVDERIIGVWRGTIQEKTYYLHVGTGNLTEANWMEVALILQGKDKSFYVHHKIGFPSSIGDTDFFHIANTARLVSQLRGSTKEQLLSSVSRYDSFKYDVTEEYLDVFPANQEFLKDTIKAGKIKGKDATIDDTPENLRHFIESSRAKLFGKAIRFVRVK